MNKFTKFSAAALFLAAASPALAKGPEDVSFTKADNNYILKSEHKVCTKDKYLVNYTVSISMPVKNEITAKDMIKIADSFRRHAQPPMTDLFRNVTKLETNDQVQAAIKANDFMAGLNDSQRHELSFKMFDNADYYLGSFDRFAAEADPILKESATGDEGAEKMDIAISITDKPSPLCRQRRPG